mmetsp:Transcript_6556/g.21177  ORF Transcript_6556/g.21177 Transcript_6556/m.21177 type:complete len:338 (-) Transcript_6556:218-1231(-)
MKVMTESPPSLVGLWSTVVVDGEERGLVDSVSPWRVNGRVVERERCRLVEETKTRFAPVRGGDDKHGECPLCAAQPLALASPLLLCCGRQMCSQCAFRLKRSAFSDSCPFCRRSTLARPGAIDDARTKSDDDPRFAYNFYMLTLLLLGDPPTEAKTLMRQLCDAGYNEARVLIASRSGPEDDSAKALLEAAANDGSGPALRLLGDWSTGNARRAYYERGGQNSDPSCLFALAAMHADDGNFDAAFQLYCRAAELGSTTAMVALAELYRRGLGCETNLLASLDFLNQAAYLGDQGALQLMDQVGLTVTEPDDHPSLEASCPPSPHEVRSLAASLRGGG